MRFFETWEEVGARLAEAREERGLTQDRLASMVGLDRTALAKIERGVRGVSSLELARLAAALERPIDWFIREAPQAVVSRRADQIESRTVTSLDALLEQVARDTELILELGGLPDPQPRPPRLIKSFADAEDLATELRREIDAGTGPLVDIGSVVQQLGLYAFVFETPSNNVADGAYVALSNSGVTVINGNMPSGRRRFTLAHELGHHFLSDAYSTDYLDEGTGTIEGLINAFAAYLLMPRDGATKFWRSHNGEQDPRVAMIELAAHYRLSWSAACSQAHNLGLIDDRLRAVLAADPPRRADYLELGAAFVEELLPPWLPPDYQTAVIKLYRRNKISRERTLDLLHETLEDADLPAPYEIPIDALRSDLARDR